MMATTLEDLAKDLSFVLKEEIHVENDCIVLGGVEPSDHAFLQIGANDGRFYFSAPIVNINEADKVSEQHLSILMELNGDTKNYPRGRIAYNSIGGSAHWIELIEEGLSAQDLVRLIEERGKLIAHIRYALTAVEKS
jgi:hypothetical protein